MYDIKTDRMMLSLGVFEWSLKTVTIYLIIIIILLICVLKYWCLLRFKAKGMDVGVSDEYLNGVPIEASSSEPEEDEEGEFIAL